MGAIQRADREADRGCPCIYTTVKINTRTAQDQSLESKVVSVKALL